MPSKSVGNPFPSATSSSSDENKSGRYTIAIKKIINRLATNVTMTSLLLIPNISPNKIEYASFHSITTHGDGSVGIQINRDLQRLTIQDDVTTHGREKESLVKGKVLKLKAYALSVLKNGHFGELSVGGSAMYHRPRSCDVNCTGEY
jgi:hypothetical protein